MNDDLVVDFEPYDSNKQDEYIKISEVGFEEIEAYDEEDNNYYEFSDSDSQESESESESSSDQGEEVTYKEINLQKKKIGTPLGKEKWGVEYFKF